MVAELRLWNQGRSEKEWMLEREELVVRSNCFHRHCTMVIWTSGMIGRGR